MKHFFKHLSTRITAALQLIASGPRTMSQAINSTAALSREPSQTSEGGTTKSDKYYQMEEGDFPQVFHPGVLPIIGRGGYALVLAGKTKADNAPLAVKVHTIDFFDQENDLKW